MNELDRQSQNLNAGFTLRDCLFWKLTKNVDPKMYYYSGCGIGFDSRSLFSYPHFYWGKNVVIFGVDNSSSVHAHNKRKHILILGEGPTEGLRDASITAEAKYSINFLRSQIKFCLSLHRNGSNSFLFVNASKIYEFKAKALK